MKCPSCASAELLHDTRDMPYTYKGETTLIPAVNGDFCPACGKGVLDASESARTSAAMLDFNKQGVLSASLHELLVFVLISSSFWREGAGRTVDEKQQPIRNTHY